ncbi:hypothetical protein KKF91_03750 [Myxococcota bacterium]|nr:hypothetical protein [Myxococcota bacterium]
MIPLLAALLLAAPSPQRTPSPLDDYRRVEMRVAPSFTARCQTQGRQVRCDLSARPLELARLLAALGEDTLARPTLEARRGQHALRLDLREGVAFQHARLESPPRWVVELGAPMLLIQPIQEELPFQPYPLSMEEMDFAPPPPRLAPLKAEDVASTRYNRCYAAYLGGEDLRVIELCGADTSAAAKALVAEAWGRRLLSSWQGRLVDGLAALEAAEVAAPTPLLGARYALLAAEAQRRRGFPEKAELSLESRAAGYRGGPAAPYITAARARLLLLLGEQRMAKGLLDQLDTEEGPSGGQAAIMLAGLAYSDGQHVIASALLQRIQARWPELLAANPKALFMAAELSRLYRRDAAAESLYQTALRRYPDAPPHWIVRVRLAELLAAQEPARARDQFAVLATTLRAREGQDLAFLRLAALSKDAAFRRRLLDNLARGDLSDFARAELLTQQARMALDDGDIDRAYIYARQLWMTQPKAPILTRAPLLFERLLLLRAHFKLKIGDPYAVMRMYYDQRQRFERHPKRGWTHLIAGRALKALGMREEALAVLQRGLGGRTDEGDPDIAARLYREIASVLWREGDLFRLKTILDYLDERHPRRFDDHQYWMAKGTRARLEGRVEDARAIFNFAINHPEATRAQRVELAGAIAELHIQAGRREEAIKALNALIQIHDEAGGELADLTRRDALWRVAELRIEEAAWPQALAALHAFLRAYPHDPARHEAAFFKGKAQLAVGDEWGAMRTWDLLAKAQEGGTFGALARSELELLRWQRDKAPEIVKRAGLAPEPAPQPPPPEGASPP